MSSARRWNRVCGSQREWISQWNMKNRGDLHHNENNLNVCYCGMLIYDGNNVDTLTVFIAGQNHLKLPFVSKSVTLSLVFIFKSLRWKFKTVKKIRNRKIVKFFLSVDSVEIRERRKCDEHLCGTSQSMRRPWSGVDEAWTNLLASEKRVFRTFLSTSGINPSLKAFKRKTNYFDAES